MKWLTETIITLTPLSLAVLLFAAMCLGWVIYGLRGYKYWWKRFHHYKTVPTRRAMKRNYGYVEYVPEVTNTPIAFAPAPVKRAPQIIHKTAPAPIHIPMNTPVAAAQPIVSTKDDLRVIEGIGPKIEEILNSNGVYTWRELALTPVSNLKAMLERAGTKFQMHDPKTWPEQAKMADTGEWDELKKYQDFLHGGRG